MGKCPHAPAQDPAVSSFEFDPRNWDDHLNVSCILNIVRTYQIQ
jgi:hypothetical protein